MKTETYSLSRFSVLFDNEDENYLCYNSRSNSFISITKDLYDFLTKNGNLNIEQLPENVVSNLIKMKIIVTSEEDDEYVERLKLQNYINRYSRDHLSLTLLPTMACNLRCPYCFEAHKSAKSMNEEVIDSLIQFINRQKYAKTYSLCWYGGEPLLRVDIMRNILQRLEKDVVLERIHHYIITNGVLLNDKAIELFQEFPLDNIQITFDGLPQNHNQKRYLPNNRGTFDIILNNIKRYLNTFPNKRITIRVNIDNQNKEEFHQVYKLLHCELKDFQQNLFIYPGILKDENPSFSICNNNLMNNNDIKKLYLELKEKDVPVKYYPVQKLKGCTANQICGYVIGTDGEIYRCWLDVGEKKYVVGNIKDDQITNEKLFLKYFSIGDCFNDQKCLNCALLPICSGGCPNNRIQNACYGKHFEICPVQQPNNYQGLKEYLQMHYQLNTI